MDTFRITKLDRNLLRSSTEHSQFKDKAQRGQMTWSKSKIQLVIEITSQHPYFLI